MIPRPFLVACREHRNGQQHWLNEWHATHDEALTAGVLLSALGWGRVTISHVPRPPEPSGGRVGLACGGQRALPLDTAASTP